MRPSTASIFGLRALDRVSTTDYVDWAVAMLTEGHDSPNLRMLAGLESVEGLMETEDHFSRALRELQIPEPDQAGKLRAYACELAQQILDGVLSSEVGVKALYQLYLASKYADGFRVWLYLNDALDDVRTGNYPYTYKTVTVENFDSIVKIEARRFIDSSKRDVAT